MSPCQLPPQRANFLVAKMKPKAPNKEGNTTMSDSWKLKLMGLKVTRVENVDIWPFDIVAKATL